MSARLAPVPADGRYERPDAALLRQADDQPRIRVPGWPQRPTPTR